MNETKNAPERTADGDPLIDRGTADSARGSVTEPEEDEPDDLDDTEENDEETEDDEEL